MQIIDELTRCLIVGVLGFGSLGVILWVIEQIWPSFPEITPSQRFAEKIGFGKAGAKVSIDNLVKLDRLQQGLERNELLCREAMKSED